MVEFFVASCKPGLPMFNVDAMHKAGYNVCTLGINKKRGRRGQRRGKLAVDDCAVQTMRRLVSIALIYDVYYVTYP